VESHRTVALQVAATKMRIVAEALLECLKKEGKK
jgi:hypothetical protein